MVGPASEFQSQTAVTPATASSQSIVAPQSVSQPASSQAVTPPVPARPMAERTSSPALSRPRPASISITKPQAQAGVTAEPGSQYQARQVAEVQSERFTQDDLMTAWREFGGTITDDIKRVGFINTNMPRLVTDTMFEVQVNNVMQESELKKIQTDIVQFMMTRLRNSSIKMQVRIIEESEKQRSITPEERYKIMVEQNPLLEKLRKNIGFEID